VVPVTVIRREKNVVVSAAREAVVVTAVFDGGFWARGPFATLSFMVPHVKQALGEHRPFRRSVRPAIADPPARRGRGIRGEEAA
jgi:hypothetical protein